MVERRSQLHVITLAQWWDVALLDRARELVPRRRTGEALGVARSVIPIIAQGARTTPQLFALLHKRWSSLHKATVNVRHTKQVNRFDTLTPKLTLWGRTRFGEN